MKNGLLRDMVILICSKRNFWHALSTQIFSRALWCAEIAAVLTFWAFRGEINSCKGLTKTMAMRQPLTENNSLLFEVLACWQSCLKQRLKCTYFFWQHHFDSTRISPNRTWQSAAGWFLYSIKSCIFLTLRFGITFHVVSSRWTYTPPWHSTWNLKISHWKRAFVLKTIIPSFHVRFWGCIIGSFFGDITLK